MLETQIGWKPASRKGEWLPGSYFLIFILAFFAAQVCTEGRPRIGLVLGGGGARGLAHVGVIRWLEEHQIPVDFAVGTSMGGLVGALLAMGQSSGEMEQTIRRLDWEELFASSPPYQDLSFRRKEDTRKFQNDLELGWKKGLTAPEGISAGHFIGLLFNRLTLPYSEIRSFDELPIPFRCVATDLEKGRPKVLKDGSLSQALRATMAIPGVFTPVERDGLLLADGGILNNLPSDVAREIGAEIVIAVDVGSTLRDRKTLQSIFGILDQMITIMMLDNVRRNQKYADLILVPEVSKYGTLDFDALEPLIALGYEAAENKRLALEGFAIDDNEWAQYLQGKRLRRKDHYPQPTHIEVTGVEGIQKREIESALEPHAGRELDPQSIEKDLTRLYGNGRYYGLGYRVKQDKSLSTVDIRVTPKSYGPPFLRFGFLVDGSDLSNIDFGVGGRMTFFDLGGYGSELRLDVGLGKLLGAGVEYYRPLRGGFFMAGRGRYHRNISNLYEGRWRVAEFRTSLGGGGLDFGYGAGSRKHELRIGYDYSQMEAGVRVGVPSVNPLEGPLHGFSLRWSYDGLDHPVIPRQGMSANLAVNRYIESPGSNQALTQFSADFAVHQRIRDQGSLFLLASSGTTVGEDVSTPLQFTLGGPFRLGAYGNDELRGSRFFYSRFGFKRLISRGSLILSSRVFAGAYYELGSAYDRGQYVGLGHSASAGIIIESILGPVFLGGSIGDEKRAKAYFYLGTVF